MRDPKTIFDRPTEAAPDARHRRAAALIDQDAAVPAERFAEYRRELEDRLQRAARRERRARAITLAVLAAAPIAIAVAMATDRAASLPRAVGNAASLVAAVLVMAAGPLLLLYLLRHRRSAGTARDAARDAAFQDLERKLDDLARRPPPPPTGG